MKFGVVSELLSDISFQDKKNTMQVTMIPRNKIIKNSRNGYAITGIEELAADIKRSGLAQPLEVMELPDGTYRQITGERRLTAIDQLITSGNWTGDIPCIVRDLAEYDLPLSDNAKEMYAIIRTNRFNRRMSDADLMFEAQEWEKIIKELRKNGVTELPIGRDENGNDINIALEGRTREIVSQTMQVSNGQLAKINFIKTHGIPELEEAIREERLSIAVAYQIAAMEKDEQKALMEAYQDGKIEATQVASFQKEKFMEESEEETAEETSILEPASVSEGEELAMNLDDSSAQNDSENMYDLDVVLYIRQEMEEKYVSLCEDKNIPEIQKLRQKIIVDALEHYSSYLLSDKR